MSRLEIRMSKFLDRLKHHAKVTVGSHISRFLLKQYLRGKGPASHVISAFSEKAARLGIERKTLDAPRPIGKALPVYSLTGQIETEYRSRFMEGGPVTREAGIISAKNVDISFPTGMHRIGGHVLEEAMPAAHVLTNPKYYYGLQSMHFRRKYPMDEAVLLSMPWQHKFYHWMIEFIPRLLLYDRSPGLQDLPLIVPRSAPKFVSESLEATGYLSRTRFLADGSYRFKTLHMLSMPAPTTEVSPDAVDWLNRKFKVESLSDRAKKRIYVSRRDAKIRFISNEDQLAGVLADFGFETIDMSGLSLVDQISVFRSAECIVGPHGAAFANLAFSEPGSTFVEFFSRGHYSPSFNRISKIRMLKYGFLVGEPTRLGGFAIDPDDLRTIFSRVFASNSNTWRE
jgi:hypothetical protein